MREDHPAIEANPSNGEFFDELQKAVAMMRRAFLRQGLQPPTAVIISDRETGDYMRASVPRNLLMAMPDVGEQGPEWVLQLQGVNFRYPGIWEAEPGGGRKLV